MKDIATTMLSYLLLSIFIININGYLYDLRHTIVVNTNSVSKDKDCFGYSLDFSKDSYGNPWLLVGAPKAIGGNLQIKSGTVYTCNLGNLNQKVQCNEIQTTMKNAAQDGIFEDQLLGATLETVTLKNSQEEIVACAPRYQFPIVIGSKTKETYYVMRGHCFTYTKIGENDFSSNERVEPLKGKKLFYGRQGWTGDDKQESRS
jgi:hypothetical protein